MLINVTPGVNDTLLKMILTRKSYPEMITGPLCGESACHRWFTSQNASIGDLLIVYLDMFLKKRSVKIFSVAEIPFRTSKYRRLSQTTSPTETSTQRYIVVEKINPTITEKQMGCRPVHTSLIWII